MGAQARGLLRVLRVRHGAVSAEPAAEALLRIAATSWGSAPAPPCGGGHAGARPAGRKRQWPLARLARRVCDTAWSDSAGLSPRSRPCTLWMCLMPKGESLPFLSSFTGSNGLVSLREPSLHERREALARQPLCIGNTPWRKGIHH